MALVVGHDGDAERPDWPSDTVVVKLSDLPPDDPFSTANRKIGFRAR